MKPTELADDSDETRMRLKRCRRCGYLLAGLESGRCPECGLEFDLADPATFTVKMPFDWRAFWMPPIMLSGIGGSAFGAAGVFLLHSFTGAELAIPFIMGALLGYATNSSAPGAVALGWALAIAYVTVFFAMLGTEWACCLGSVGLFPALLGTGCGYILRRMLKNLPSFSQKEYLA